jgi:hypothetical protein
VEDEAAPKPEWAPLPAGTPIRVREWVIPPLFLLGLAAIETWAALSAGSRGLPLFSAFAVSICIVAAGVLTIFGYHAYRDLTARAAEQYLRVGMASLFLAGALMSLGYVGWILLALVGRMAADRTWRPLRLLRTIMPRRRWQSVAIIAATVAVIGLFLLPVARILDSIPLITLAITGRIVGPLVFGFATRLRPGATGLF